ncbi:diguanylate cyclase domain-containing protein [Sulfurimonas sp.]|uniref:diguanylate cyclase domain-containing protein n=1 Tax=Sulfurimonas sp. TaxID=2022749 RepID=UPI0039E61720
MSSETDFLTKLANRLFYERRLKENIATAKRNKTYLSHLMIDINNLKEYYDTYGHDSGDIVLFDLMKKTGAYFSTFSYNSQDNNRLNLTSYFY